MPCCHDMKHGSKTSNDFMSGKYCQQEGLESPNGDCDPGFYCPAGSIAATPGNHSCPEGYFCVGAKEAPEACPSGMYQVGAGFKHLNDLLAFNYTLRKS